MLRKDCHKYFDQHVREHHQKHSAKKDSCCNELLLRRHYRQYHRFFMFSPLLLLTLFLMMVLASRNHVPNQASILMSWFLIILFVKEFIGFAISRRIFLKFLLPIEELKQGVFEVTQGNYQVQIKSYSVPEIDALIEAFNGMSAQLHGSELLKQKYEENRKELLANISHDLKTPITSINGFVDGILDGVAEDSAKQENYLRIIQQNARYMNRLIDDLVLYSKLDIQKLDFQFSTMDIQLYVTELFQELQLENEEYGVRMSQQSKLEHPVEVDLDGRHMARAVRNIVNNARTHGHGENPPQIDFLLAGNDSSVSLTISDNGPGIPADKLPFIFDRFFRADEARTPENGCSGLGLAISREIIATHGGTLSAVNRPEGGTAITLTLPLKKESGIYEKTPHSNH